MCVPQLLVKYLFNIITNTVKGLLAALVMDSQNLVNISTYTFPLLRDFWLSWNYLCCLFNVMFNLVAFFSRTLQLLNKQPFSSTYHIAETSCVSLCSEIAT